MTTITLDVPEQIADDLLRHQDRISEVLELGLKQLTPAPAEIYRYIFDFLFSEPKSSEILAFRPTPAMEQRLRQLVQREKDGEITDMERVELDEYERIEHFIVMLKSGHLNKLVG